MGTKVKQYEMTVLVDASPEQVFNFMDDIENAGMHMTENSAAMMGSKLSIEWITSHKTGLGATYRWTGKVMGMKMDFTVEVNQWEKNQYKVWGTVGAARMIVIDWFEMYMQITPKENLTEVLLGIRYTISASIPGILLGRAYSKWCVKNMIRDMQKHFLK